MYDKKWTAFQSTPPCRFYFPKCHSKILLLFNFYIAKWQAEAMVLDFSLLFSCKRGGCSSPSPPSPHHHTTIIFDYILLGEKTFSSPLIPFFEGDRASSLHSFAVHFQTLCQSYKTSIAVFGLLIPQICFCWFVFSFFLFLLADISQRAFCFSTAQYTIYYLPIFPAVHLSL